MFRRKLLVRTFQNNRHAIFIFMSFTAVTLVAFGSAAPELFLNSVSAVAHTSDLSMSAIVGSGMIAFGLIPSLCMLNAVRHEMKLKVYPILREVSLRNSC